PLIGAEFPSFRVPLPSSPPPSYLRYPAAQFGPVYPRARPTRPGLSAHHDLTPIECLNRALARPTHHRPNPPTRQAPIANSLSPVSSKHASSLPYLLVLSRDDLPTTSTHVPTTAEFHPPTNPAKLDRKPRPETASRPNKSRTKMPP